MKKVLSLCLSLVMAAGLFSCKNSGNPVDETVKIINDATAKVEKAETPEQVREISQEVGEKMGEITKKYPDYQPSAEDQAKLGEATRKFMEASMKKTFQPATLDMSEQAKVKAGEAVEKAEQGASKAMEKAGELKQEFEQ